MAGRRYSRYLDSTTLAAGRGTDAVLGNNPLLHIGRVSDYQCTSSMNCEEDSSYCNFTPTKDKQVLQRFFFVVTFMFNFTIVKCSLFSTA